MHKIMTDSPTISTEISPITVYLREIVYGGSDGIITTFAVVAGFSGAQIDPATSSLPILSVLLFGFANLFADATSMGLGNFLSVRADQDVYHQEQSIIHKKLSDNPDAYLSLTTDVLHKKGFTPEEAQKISSIYAGNKNYWADFMTRNLMHMTDSRNENALLTSLATFSAFIVFGAVPLIPYMILNIPVHFQFAYSILGAGTALVLLGVLRWKVTKRSLVMSIVETLIIGGASALVAYGVGYMFQLN